MHVWKLPHWTDKKKSLDSVEVEEPAEKNSNMVRTEIRRLSKIGSSKILRSLQACSSVRENLEILNRYFERLVQGSSLYMKIKGMREILLYLISLVLSCINDDDITNHEAQQQRFTVGHIPFQEAYEIFNSYFLTMGFSHLEKQEFQKILLHP